MNNSQYKTEVQHLSAMMKDVMDDEPYEFFFGWHDNGSILVRGWWVITPDYPTYNVHLLGTTFGEAEETIKTEWIG